MLSTAGTTSLCFSTLDAVETHDSILNESINEIQENQWTNIRMYINKQKSGACI